MFKRVEADIGTIFANVGFPPRRPQKAGEERAMTADALKKHLRNGVESPSKAEEVTNRSEPNAQ
jgi:hypothetical protein